MNEGSPAQAIARVPPGRWAVAVSGGADSVALLTLLHRAHPEFDLCVVHLNHQTRGQESDADAAFVADLAVRLNIPCEIARIGQIAPTVNDLPRNRSARFRAIRIAFFKSVVQARRLDGVLVAHHADDQAETILLRLLRGSGYTGLAGMLPRAMIGELTVIRPLLGVRSAALREHLCKIGQDWREDSSNESPKYLRNRIRTALAARDDVSRALIEFGTSCAVLRAWVRQSAPRLGESFHVEALARLPGILAEQSARTWLSARAMPIDQITPATVAGLIEMACDAATPPSREFPGRVVVRRRGGMISAQSTR